ncbi:YdcF family protein [Micromonospora sp. PLK6-60]|uniref:ElyC/SanA/YdcF family protein n=1 Tax=Micromonospora sp. PLK6-60 TaxID=2873383 RepID=UPI001CA6F797|nr:ElyC/SanA/YdcF family protein [Micromonospora sp. PLK6-60]MBY8870609.1 YdcF family protein [Micromonospora sp. PLK6-60]
MTPPTALVLVVFGRGVHRAGDRYALTPASLARVDAAAAHIAAHEAAFRHAARHGRPPRIVFTGGWSEAGEGAPAPPPGSREADLMWRAARAAGLHRYADLRVENRSRSTLENLVHTAGDGLLAGWQFDAARPLGIVSHAGHLPRIRLLAGRVLGLRGPALLDVPATGGEPPGAAGAERVARLACRLAYLGVGDHAALIRRERAMVAALRRARRWGVVRRAPAGAAAIDHGPDARRRAELGM